MKLERNGIPCGTMYVFAQLIVEMTGNIVEVWS